jgi:hypothetical protein
MAMPSPHPESPALFEQPGPIRGFLRSTLGKILKWSLNRKLKRFLDSTNAPHPIQREILTRLIHKNRDTDFGRDHGFSGIQSLADFRKRIPVAGYDRVEPYMARVRQGDIKALLSDRRIHMFALTSGTTATRKTIPVNDQYLDAYRAGWHNWGVKAYTDHPNASMRPILQFSGDWQEEMTPSGVPCGAVTGLTARMQKRLVRGLYVLPADSGRIKDSASKYYLALRLGLTRAVSLIIAANPSTMINLARAGNEAKEDLLRDLRDGTLNSRCKIPADIRASLAPQLANKHPERVRQLEGILGKSGTLYPKDYWPSHCILGNWTGGSMGAYLRQYPRYFGNMPIRDVGLIASEGRMTIPIQDNTPSGILDINSHFFEFVPNGEDPQIPGATFLEGHELLEGREYRILLTTASGLYRYDIHDVVRCTGFLGKTPLLEFLNKGAYFSNLTGEKISEHHVTRAMERALGDLGLESGIYSVAPCWDDNNPHYGLFVEESNFGGAVQAQKVVARMETLLAETNIEYASKRDSGRLAPLALKRIPNGFWAEWDRERLAKTRGVAEQYKHPCLITTVEFRDDLAKRGLIS